MKKDSLSYDEIKRLTEGKSQEEFLNKRSPVYKEKVKGKNLSKDRILKLMAEEPVLVRRPVFASGKKIVFGFNEQDYT